MSLKSTLEENLKTKIITCIILIIMILLLAIGLMSLYNYDPKEYWLFGYIIICLIVISIHFGIQLSKVKRFMKTINLLKKGMNVYTKRKWLNNNKSASTGSIVVFDGDMTWRKGENIERFTFVEFADCHGKIRLHCAEEDTIEEFIEKVKMISNVMNDFVKHLESTLIKEDK